MSFGLHRFHSLALELGQPFAKKLHGSPLTPPDDDRGEPTHQTWFVANAAGWVAGLEIDGRLILATGEHGRIWQIEAGRARELELTDELRSSKAEPRMRSASVAPIPGRRWLLGEGLDFSTRPGRLGQFPIDQLPLAADLSTLLAAVGPKPAKPGFWQRLRGRSESPAGVALVLDCDVDEPLPAGFTAGLRELERRRLHLDWQGNEADNYPLRLFDLPRPQGDLHEALLAIWRSELERHPDLAASSQAAWTDRDPDISPAQGFAELVPGQPERGWWRAATWAELEANLQVRAAKPPWSQSVSSRDLLAHLRAAVEHPRVVAVFDIPDEASVVAWYLLGGVSITSGCLELVALQRVWS